MIHALALSVPIPAPHLPAALDVGPFVPGVAYTAPKDYYGMPVDAGYAGLINRAQQLERFNSADFPPLERRAAPEPPPAPLPIAAMPLAAAAAEGDQFVALDNPNCVPIAPGTVVALGAGRPARSSATCVASPASAPTRPSRSSGRCASSTSRARRSA